jgi:LacI family transcriptional regulator
VFGARVAYYAAKGGGGLRPGSNTRITIREVASAAGVSIKTVSRVLNGEPAVAPRTADRVAKAADRLGYEPNELARGLKGRQTRTVGLILADLSNPFFADCCKAVEQTLAAEGYALILCASAEDPESERAYVELLSRRRIDGLLLAPAPNGGGHLLREISAGLPVVAFDRPADGVETDTILVSNRNGAAEATRHLISHGHTRVSFIGDDEHIYTAEKRLRGYSQAMKEAGLEPEYRMGRGTIPHARETAAELLVEGHGTTAFLGGNSLITAGILHALDDARVRIPEDAAVVGFDDFQFVSALRPSLTVVRQPTELLGVKAARMLLDRLNGSDNETPRRKVLNTELIVRGSCGCTMI